jgi:deazaflavin-dependent oxidoreductase (nitroreductase family)
VICDDAAVNIFRKAGMAVARGGMAVQVWMYRRSGGRRGGKAPGGVPLLLLTTTGRKSGARRTRPVGFLPQGDGFVVCGSNGGSDRPPAWSLNLRANPAATVEVKERTLPVTASEVTGADYEPMWQAYTAAYPGFARYRTKTQRHLPLFVLQPSTPDGSTDGSAGGSN